MVPFNGALLARNRDEVMDQLIGGYANWQQVGRWGSGAAKFLAPVPQSGRGRVSSRISELGGTSKGHALVRFNFEVEDANSGHRMLEGWMLLFLLGCAPDGAGAISPPRIAMPDREEDEIQTHSTPLNVTFDWESRVAGHAFVQAQLLRQQQGQPTISINDGFRPMVRTAARHSAVWLVVIAAAGIAATAVAAMQTK